MAEEYSYTPIDSAGGQIRLLTIAFDVKQTLGYSNINPLSGSLKPYYLPISSHPRAKRLVRSVQIPTFFALSYVWGEPASSHEILIDGKKLGITKNLYNALRVLQRDAIGDFKVWADAVCINQKDLAERSDQVFLMREVYHSAAQVRIWLGPTTKDGLRCMKFIAKLTDGFWYATDPKPGSEVLGATEEKVLKVLGIPGAAISNAGHFIYGFGDSIKRITDAMAPEGRDDKAVMFRDPDGNLSLHRETVEELSKWRPSDSRLRKVKDENFAEIASLIDEHFIQKCTWFERMWVVQELGVADNAGIAYGNGVESWENFLRAVYYLHYNCKAPIANIRKLTGLEKIRMGWNDRLRQPLRELIRECRYRRATDPRDKIFALLGLMGDGMNPLLQPDYKKSVAEVYAHATQHLINQAESLDPICGWQTLGRDDLPSWVPDYNLNQDLVASPIVSIDGRESIFAASGYDSRSKYHSSMADWTSLAVAGLCVDVVSLHSDPASDEASLGSIGCIWQSTILAAGHILDGLTKKVESGLEIISTAVTNCTNYWNPAEKPYSKSLDSSSKVNLSLEDVMRNQPPSSEDQKSEIHLFDTYIPDAYLHSLVCGRQTRTERFSRRSAQALVNMRADQTSANDSQNAIMGLICKALEDGMRRRSIAITRKGYIGAMPQEVQAGDLVCVLFGCSVPVLLRKRGNDSYSFIGECYLHGFMDAEAISLQVKGQLKEQEFVIR